MKDIANDLGLSVVTISKVLRNHPDISEETRARVQKYVQESGFQPNMMARSLVTGRSYLIGLIVPDLLHPFFAEIAKALSRSIRAKGYSLLISSSEEDPGLEEQELQQMMARKIDGIVVASTALSGKRFEEMRTFKERPVLLIDRHFGNSADSFVGVDDLQSGRLATEHLIQIGCRRIAHIAGRDNSTGSHRAAGYREALASHGLPFIPRLVVRRANVDSESLDQGAAAARLLLDAKTRPDGIFCYNDPLAIGAMQTILAAGLRIPEDIALIGCGNLHYDDTLRVPLSSIDQQTATLGQRAGEIILGMAEKKGQSAPANVVLQPSIVVRASSQRPVT